MIFCWQAIQKCFHLRSFDPANYPRTSLSPYLTDGPSQAESRGQRHSAGGHSKNITWFQLRYPQFDSLARSGLGMTGIGGEFSQLSTKTGVDLDVDVEMNASMNRCDGSGSDKDGVGMGVWEIRGSSVFRSIE